MLTITGPEPEFEPELDKIVPREYGAETCPNCEQLFVKRREWQLFCSTECRMQSHQRERKDALKEYRQMVKSRFPKGIENAE